MSLTNQQFLKDTLHKFWFYTKKGLWQNFLIDEFVLSDIVNCAEIEKNDRIIEIWPGPWVLTQELIKKWAKITALEIDEKAIPILEYSTQNPENLEIFHQNALEYRPKKSWYILCANIPYYLTSPLLRHYLSWKYRPKILVFLMQKEVAQRICEKPKNLSVLALEVLVFWKPEIIRTVERNKFFPAPNVDSAVLKVKVFEKPLVEKEDLALFWNIVHHCFWEKRKKLSNTFWKYREMWAKNAEIILEKSWIDWNRRPQTIQVEEWKKIIEIFKEIF